MLRKKNKNLAVLTLYSALFAFVLFYAFAPFISFAQIPDNNTQEQNDEQNTQTNPDQNNNSEQNTRRFSSEGIFGCTAKLAAPVGMPGPNGAHVPVFDIAVHSHVQILTYKECVLDSIVRRLTNANLATVVSNYIDKVNKTKLCRNGVCRYGLAVGDINEYLENMVAKPLTLKFYKEICKKNVDKDAQDVCDKILLDKKEEFDDPYKFLRCPLSDEDIKLYRAGKLLDQEKYLIAINNPACDKINIYTQGKLALDILISKEQEKEKWEITIGRGFAPIKAKIKKKVRTADGIKEVDSEITVTPGSVIADHLSFVLGSGVRRLETADEIDETVQSFFANLGNAILDENIQGLYGINKVSAEQGAGLAISYLDALVQQEADSAKGARFAVGAKSLQNLLANQIAYIEAKTKTAEAILNAIHNLREYENACFEQKIIPGATESIKNDLQNQLCPSQSGASSSASDGQNTPVCSVSFSENTKTLNFFDIKEKKDGSTIMHGDLIFYGKDSDSNATLIVSNGDKLKSEQISVSSSWQKEIKSSELPEGDLEATLTLSDGSVRTQSFYKETIANIPIIVLPSLREKIKIKVDASATVSNTNYGTSTQNASKEVVLQLNRKYAQEYTGKNTGLTNKLREILQDIARARQTLEELQDIAVLSQSDPDLALWRLDKLKIETDEYGKSKVVFASDLRSAQDEASNASGIYPNTVQSVLRDKWEAEGRGWCNKDKWQEFQIND